MTGGITILLLGSLFGPAPCDGVLQGTVVDAQTGQPLSGSLLDYGLPRADHFPMFLTELNEVPSPTNPLGVKAGGEGGTTGALAAVVNAIVDALQPYGVRDLKMPVTPYQVWQAIHKRKAPSSRNIL